MRLSREAKAEHHEEITTAASQMLRERGIERTSLAELMQSVGLTHGGFYRHFKSKDDLVVASAVQAFEEVRQRFEQRTADAGPKAALKAYILEYLSEDHRDDPSVGCMIASCGVEASRGGKELRSLFTAGIAELLDLIAAGLPGTPKARAEKAVELSGMMLGAIVMARATNDAKLSSQILASARRRALQLIG